MSLRAIVFHRWVQDQGPSRKKLTVFDRPELSYSCHKRPKEVTVQMGFFVVKQGDLLFSEIHLMHVVSFDLDEVLFRLPDFSHACQELSSFLPKLVKEI